MDGARTTLIKSVPKTLLLTLFLGKSRSNKKLRVLPPDGDILWHYLRPVRFIVGDVEKMVNWDMVACKMFQSQSPST